MVRLSAVNAHIAHRGGKERLVRSREPRGKNYFYFINCGPDNVPSEAIPVNRLSQFTIEQWLETWEETRRKYGQS